MKLTLRPLEPGMSASIRICEYPAALMVMGPLTEAEDKGIRNEIIRRVNAHDFLLNALKEAVDALSTDKGEKHKRIVRERLEKILAAKKEVS